MKNPKDKRITKVDTILPDGKEILQELQRMFFFFFFFFFQ